MRKRIMSLESISEEDELINIPEVNSPEEVIQSDVIESPGTIAPVEYIEGQELNTNIDCVSDSIDEAVSVVTTLESIANKLKNSELTPSGAKVLNIAIEHMLSKIGYPTKVSLVIESFGGTMSKANGTKAAMESIKEFAKTIWETIKAAFAKMWQWVKDFFNWITRNNKNVEAELDKSIENVNSLFNVISSGKEITTESLSLEANSYNLNKELTIAAGDIGQYLGNNKKEIDTYIDSLKDIDNVILFTLAQCDDDLSLNVTNVSSDFKLPFTSEQKAFFKDKIPFTTSVAKVVPLSFKKGFIWKIEGASIDHTGKSTEMLNVNAGVRRTNYMYDIEDMYCLTLDEVKNYLNKLKDDLVNNGKNTHTTASKILSSVNVKLKSIESLLGNTSTEDDQEFKDSRYKFTKAKETLNALKNIEIGYWQYKTHTTMRIKQYCDASISARRKDYKQSTMI